MISTTGKLNQPGVIIVEGRQTAGPLLMAAKEFTCLPQTATRAGRVANATSNLAGEVGWPGKVARPANSRSAAQPSHADAEAFSFDHLAGLDVAAVRTVIATAERAAPQAAPATDSHSSLAAAMIAAAGSQRGGK